MGAGLRDVKRRIRSVQSTKKITRAMELIAASRVVKAQQAIQQARPYSNAITTALTQFSEANEMAHPFLQSRENVRKAAVVVVTSDRGSAGPYSSNVLRQAERLYAQLREKSIEPVVFALGRKGNAYYRFRNRPIAKSWTGFSDGPSYENAKEVADAAIEAYKSGEVDEIYAVYTNFVSSITQRTVVRRFMPLEIVEVERSANPKPSYEYEPDSATVLDSLLPRYIEVRMFTAFLESAASEHAARRRAMSTATDNASNLIEDLTRQYNRARQAEITQELMEVVGAAEAFSGSK